MKNEKRKKDLCVRISILIDKPEMGYSHRVNRLFFIKDSFT